MLEPIDGWTLSEWDCGPAKPVLVGPNGECVGLDGEHVCVTLAGPVVRLPMAALDALVKAHREWSRA